MDCKKEQTTLLLAESEHPPVYRKYAESSSTSFSKKLVVKSVFGLVSLTLVVALTLTAVYLGGKITNEVVKESYYTFRFPDGTTIREKITFTNTEEDINVLGRGTRIIYDYSKGYRVMKVKDDGVAKCYVSTFERTRATPLVVDKDSMLQTNVTILQKTDYFTEKNEIVDTAIFSPRSRDMCQGLPVYWTTTSKKLNENQAQRQRQKRDLVCEPSCHVTCSFPGKICGLSCSDNCVFTYP